RVVDVWGLKRAGRPKSLRAAEGHRFGAGAFAEACLPVHEYLYLTGPTLLGQGLRQFGQEVLANHAGKLFREGVLDFLVAGSFNRGCVRIVGMNAESAARLGFNVEGELGPLISGRKISRGKIQSGKFPGHGGTDAGLNLFLQLLARGGFERREAGIAGMGDESALRLGLDAVSERADDALNIHGFGAIVARLTERER